MIQRVRVVCGLSLLLATAASNAQPLRPIPFTDVSLTDSFWTGRQRVLREVTLPLVLQRCEETGRIENFSRAAGKTSGPHQGRPYNDSDVYKWLEAASYALATNADGKLAQRVDEVISQVAAAQQPDGYLNTYVTLTDAKLRFTNLEQLHELYCAGHLIEAGIAHAQATRNTTLLSVARKFADLLEQTFGPDKRRDVCGHPEIELALLKLADATNEPRYRALAEFFLAQRGVHEQRSSYGEYCQDHAPLASQRALAGHAVRAMYLLAGAAERDRQLAEPLYRDASLALWNDLTTQRLYITGGLGASKDNEGFTQPFDLPNDEAYSETCASIGLIYWAQRMHRLHMEGQYVEVIERALYNAVLAGVSLDGRTFHYTNPLASRGKHLRRDWFDTACCPPNLLRCLLTLGEHAFSVTDDAVFINLYIAGEARTRLRDTPVTIRVQGNLPWDTGVRIYVQPQQPIGKFDVYLRLPSWCVAPEVRVNGSEPRPAEIAGGYMRIRREWRIGEEIALHLPMRAQRVEANPRATALLGRVALQRGPLVFALEGVDNNNRVRSLSLPPDAELKTEFKPDLLGGIAVISGVAREPLSDAWGPQLYRNAALTRTRPFKAIPYYAWNNRDAGEMIIWIPESPTLCEPATTK